MSTAPSPGWANKGEASLAYLDFLTDELFLGTEPLDPNLVAAVNHIDQPKCSPTTEQSLFPSRSPAETNNLSLKEEDDDDLDEPEGASDERPSKCRRTEITPAARNKACREKARRERINDRFQELAQLLDPGKEPKTDKCSILLDAIRMIQQSRAENNQLKQLNKFLEERAAQFERERGQQLYQQALLQTLPQQQLQHQQQLQQQQLQQQQQQLHQQQLQQQQLQHLLPSLSAPCSMLQQSSTLLQPGSTLLQQPCVTGVPMHGLAGPSHLGLQQQALLLGPSPAAAAQQAYGMGGKGVMMSVPSTSLSLVQAPYWIVPSALDTTKDSLLRPPVA